MYIYELGSTLTYTSDGVTPVLIWAHGNIREEAVDFTYVLQSDLDGTLYSNTDGYYFSLPAFWGGVLTAGEHTITLTTPSGGVQEPSGTQYILQEQSFGGGGGGTATTSPYIIDVGSTLMLGGILAFLIAYWIVGLVRNRKNTWNT